jgi:hypothetical protein
MPNYELDHFFPNIIWMRGRDENGSDTDDITDITFVLIFLSRFRFEYG